MHSLYRLALQHLLLFIFSSSSLSFVLFFLRSLSPLSPTLASKVAESEVVIAFAEDLQRIDTVATQLMEMERRASSVRDRPLDHFCTISHEVMTDPVLTMCGHTFGMSI